MYNPNSITNNKISYKFENVPSLDENMRYSDEFNIEGFKWKIGIRKSFESPNYFLSVFLNCSSDEKERAWICAVDAKYFILRQNDWWCETKFDDTKYFTYGKTEFGEHFRSFPWSSFVHPTESIIQNKSLTIDFNFNFFYQNFSKSIPNYTDITLNVEGADVHLNKDLLCSYSEYFRDIYAERQTDDTAVKIDDDVKLENFVFLLAAMHPRPFLTNPQVFNCLELADRFKVPSIPINIAFAMYSVLEYKHISREHTIDGQYIATCIHFADKYDYDKVMTMALRCFKTLQEIKEFSKRAGFEDLTKNTKILVLNRILEIA